MLKVVPYCTNCFAYLGTYMEQVCRRTTAAYTSFCVCRRGKHTSEVSVKQCLWILIKPLVMLLGQYCLKHFAARLKFILTHSQPGEIVTVLPVISLPLVGVETVCLVRATNLSCFSCVLFCLTNPLQWTLALGLCILCVTGISNYNLHIC